MTAASLDRLLALLVVGLVASGLVSLRMGSAGDAWLFALHGVLAAALAITAGWKVGRSLPRAIRAGRWRRVALGLVLSAGTAAALVGGFAWVVSGRLLSIGSWTVLTIHAWIGLALLPVVSVHLAPRRWRLLVPRRWRLLVPGRRSRPAVRPNPGLTRRRLLAGGVLGAISIAIFGLAQAADQLAGGVRRFTGSRWLPAGGVPPPTTFFGEGAPAIDRGTWRLRIHGLVERETSLSADDLAGLGDDDVVAVLDCTSGWAIETTWSGVRLATVLNAADVGSGHASVVVRSVTGWATSLSRSDADRALLASHVAGRPLPVANGAPFRLVVPDHRGLDWVKWVDEIEVA